jgi:hypothetical protein
MSKRERKDADWFDLQEQGEVDYRAGYAWYLAGEPSPEGVSASWLEGWRHAKRDVITAEPEQRD